MDALQTEISVFGVGLGIGLIVTVLVWLGKRRTQSSLRKEIETLKGYLNTQMSINSKGYEELRKEVETLRKQNENLRVTVATLSNKPGRAELKTLHIWDRALRSLVVSSPGFAPAWEVALAEAQKNVEETDSGVKALVRKVFPMLPHESSASTSDSTDGS
ncbi:MAG: hypothetical protein IGR76_09150 [Synechococcales cyanobacterium T60_A2020_003]|nr:hypothetical protein [Synechococcales cyanobacterium T60_A2020_003]